MREKSQGTVTPRTLLLLAAVVLPALAPAESADDFRWRLEPDAFAAFRIQILEQADSLLDGFARYGEIDDVAGFHGYELSSDGRRLLRRVTHVELLPAPFVFALPKRPVLGERLQFRETLGGNWRLEPFAARGYVEVIAGPDETGNSSITLAGAVQFEHRQGGPEAYHALRAGRLEWTAHFDVARGLMTDVVYEMACETTGGTRGAPPSVHAVDPRARTRKVKVRLDLERVRSYRYPGFDQDVARAIAEGLDYLESQQLEDGSWGDFGRTALCLLALVDGGRPGDHPTVERGFAWLLRGRPWRGEERERAVYSIGVSLMALERRRTPAEEVQRRQRGLDVEFLPRRLTGIERVWMGRCVQFLLEVAVVDGGPGTRGAPVTGPAVEERWSWGYGTDRGGNYWDNSNTQYAVLGLESAARCGIPVPGQAWLGIAHHFLVNQAQDGRGRRDLVLEYGGVLAEAATNPTSRTRSVAPVRTRSRGWGYGFMSAAPVAADPNYEVAYGSMTAAGIGSLAIARARIASGPDGHTQRKLVARIDQAILDGFACLDDIFTVWTHPQYEGWYTYYLYGLERAGMLNAVRRFGGHDWYWEGAVQLLLRQSDYGHGAHRFWAYDLGGDGTTAWAILFLKQGTPAVVTPR